MKDNITVFGTTEQNVYDQMVLSTASVDGSLGVLCADNHLGYRMPIGGVVAYPEHISPSGVGYDIGCGNNAVRTNLLFSDVKNDALKLAKEIAEQIEFGVGSKGFSSGAELEYNNWNGNSLTTDLKDLAYSQLGSVGGGNHYIDLLRDEQDYVWVANHFGSRGFGHTVAKRALQELGMKDVVVGEPALIHQSSALFDDYLEAMTVAGKYAALGRELVVMKVLEILGAKWSIGVNNHHNFAWKETHFGQDYWVIRKGSTPLRPDQPSFIGGSMGDISVIVKGTALQGSEESLQSAPHGAGRVISRSKAKKTFSYEEMNTKLGEVGVTVIGGDLDESPMAYRPLQSVLDAHPYIEIQHVLVPFVVVMAGKDIRDPYKD